MTREKVLKSPAYWFEYEQNELYRQVIEYMERENINQTELAGRLNVSKGYVSQILNGNFNYSLKKLIELCLSIGLVPQIKFMKIDDVIKKDAQIKALYNGDESIANKNGNQVINGEIASLITEKLNDFENVVNDSKNKIVKKAKSIVK